MRTPRFTFVSDGNPRRRLLIGSKKGVFERYLTHDSAPYIDALVNLLYPIKDQEIENRFATAVKNFRFQPVKAG